MSTIVKLVAGIYTGDANAVPSNIILSKTAYVNNAKITGTMPDNNGISTDASSFSQSGGTIYLIIPEGRYNTSSRIHIFDADFIASNIKHDISIMGLVGTYSHGTAVVQQQTVSVDVNLPSEGGTYTVTAYFTGPINTVVSCSTGSSSQVYQSGPSVSGNSVSYIYKNTFYNAGADITFTIIANVII